MKELVTLLALVILGFLGYKYHTDQVKNAAEKAAEEAVAKSNVARPLAVVLSRYIEPLHKELFSGLDSARPADLVPSLAITKERIIDLNTHAEPEKQAVYGKGVTLLDAMIELAEERTKALETVLKNAQTKNRLDGSATTSTSTAFFAQTAIKKWEDYKNRQKPVIDQLFTQLRTAERDWNKQMGKNARSEVYDIPVNARAFVTVDSSATTTNPLERGAYDQRRYPWRQRFYDQNGYPYPQGQVMR